MTLTIRGYTLYDDNGEKLKEISCPRKLQREDLLRRDDQHFDCSACSEVIINTDFMTEGELTALLREAPETCLYINLMNPMFEVER